MSASAGQGTVPQRAIIAAEAQARLERWLAREAGAASVRLETIAALGGGAISQNIAVDLVVEGGPLAGRHECVLRAASPAGVAASLTKPQEFAVLRAAFMAGVAAPEPLFACDDPDVVERPFYIMRRARGIGAGRLITRAVAPQPELARELGRQLALLHTIRPGADGGRETGLPDVPDAAQAERSRPPRPGGTVHGALGFLAVPQSPGLAAASLYRQWLGMEHDPQAGCAAEAEHTPEANARQTSSSSETAQAARDPVLAWGLRWLERNAPPPGDIVLCHRDYRTGNYLVDAGRLTAILDWEFCGWSDPMEDVAWFCARSWRFARPDREAGGIAGRADFYAGYEEASGRRVDPARIAFWEASAYLRWAAIAWQQGARHMSGVEPSLELALTARMLPEILADLLAHLESLEKGPLPCA
jgi:aminoglycoside phosphotransferase (APT) family kinase protein